MMFGALLTPFKKPEPGSRVLGPHPVSSWMDRLRAAMLHMVLSLLVAGMVAALVFLVWYPSPYQNLVGGQELFMLVIAVDLVMGPMLTFVAYNTKKGMSHLKRDLAIIVAMQIAALLYGMHTVWQARPVHIVFEIDRLKVVTAADIDPIMMKEAPAEFSSLPAWGPTQIVSSRPKVPSEQARSIELGMAGIDLAQQPGTWGPMDAQSQARIWAKATPLADLQATLKKRGGADLKTFDAAVVDAVMRTKLSESALRAIPLTSTRMFWTALVNEQGKVVGYANVDMF